MMLLFYLLFVYFFINKSSSSKTVEHLDLTKYQGIWYQIYGNNYDQLFEKLKGTEQIEGYKEFPRQLTVHLNGVPHDAPYWVYNLGSFIWFYTLSHW